MAPDSAQAFAVSLVRITWAGDFNAYSKLVYPGCKGLMESPKDFYDRTKQLRTIKPGSSKVVTLGIETYRKLPSRYVYSYGAPPSHIVSVWGARGDGKGGIRVELNPILKEKDGWRVIPKGCVSMKLKPTPTPGAAKPAGDPASAPTPSSPKH